MLPALHKEYGDKVQVWLKRSQYVLSKLRRPTYLDADDLVQEIVIANWQRQGNTAAKYVIWNALAPTYLTRMINYRYVPVNEYKEPVVWPDTDSYVEILQLINNNATDYQRQILIMVLRGWHHKEIAAELGRSRQSVTDAIGLFVGKAKKAVEECKNIQRNVGSQHATPVKLMEESCL